MNYNIIYFGRKIEKSEISSYFIDNILEGANMPSSVLYPVRPGQKRIKSYYTLQLKRQYSRYPHGPFLSQKAYEEIHKKGPISEVDEKGVILNGERRVVFPAIFIRMKKIFDEKKLKKPPLSPKIFIARE